jgi:hypothetical protein
MKACFLAMLALVMVSYSLAQLSYTQEQVIEYAKSIDVDGWPSFRVAHNKELVRTRLSNCVKHWLFDSFH